MRIVAPIVALALTVLIGVGVAAQFAEDTRPHRKPAGSSRTVSCSEVIMTVKFPVYGARLVLGVVSAPAGYHRQIVQTRNPAWPYKRKAGLVVTGRAPVSVSVPKAWRSRVAISWGNRPGFYSSLRIAGCPPLFGVPKGRAYAGGFRLKSRSACFPLIFRVAKRSATVRFGLGRACR
jgi:hypothetical protein